MIVFIKFPQGQTLTVDISEHDTVEALFSEVCAEKNCNDVMLTLHGQPLDIDRKLSDYEIDEGTVLHALECN
uniref:Ubiquitin-like domain-containing protein n=1 Tax=Panagrolaimus sp. JU765 TaxID=591449 RepID=A0AC34PWE6_9BILA